VSEDSILERITAAAEERKLSPNSLLAYRRTWLKIIAWAAAEGLVLETLPSERVGVCRATLFRGNGVVPVAHYFVGIGRGTTVQSVRRIAAG
jgi:hypothetical protein